jgi:hypothetical protein
MEYLITESQYHYLKRVISEQEVVSDELTNKIIDEYQRLIESANENFKRVKETLEKEFNNPKNFKYFSYPPGSKEFNDGYLRNWERYSCYYMAKQVFNFQPKVLLETIYKDFGPKLRHCITYTQILYLLLYGYASTTNTKDKKVLDNIFAKYNIKFEVKIKGNIEYKHQDFLIKNKTNIRHFPLISVNFEKINPPITTTTTTEIQKTIMPEPYFDKNTERAVKADCNMTFVGKKGKTTFDRIHRTSDGKFLGDYDKSLSLDFNIRRFCKK